MDEPRDEDRTAPEVEPGAAPSATPTTDLAHLVALVARLRAPDGCPWDREQGLPDLRAYLLEEAHEVAAAIDRADWQELAAEMGDLLFQIAFLARLGEEAGELAPGEPMARVAAKMIARHPHVFGSERLADARAVRDAWERRKLRQGEAGGERSLLDGAAAPTLPSLLAAYRLTQKAAGVGFDWSHVGEVLTKLDEELAELRAEIAPATGPTADKERLRDEVGDLLFTVANLARHLEIDPEAALAGTNLKFRRRFAHLETRLAENGRHLADATLEEMEALWQEAKRVVG
ncbi:MAG: nucleoside triphosphate pyrophosphohydrolase [Thermoanaerobaculia bacterium]